MVLKAALKNERNPEYGLVTIPFPIPKEEYDSTIRMMEALDIGDAVRQDCMVEEIQNGCSILKRLEGTQVNVDELDYLAKRMDSFDTGEAAQFQAMAEKLELTDIKDFINLTFSCQQATVITDFSDLEAIGREHYMNLNGGSALVEELKNLDGAETAIRLIEDNEGTVTRYGVVYDNGMRLEQLYRGKEFPAYLYEPCMMTVTMTSIHKAGCSENATWLFLPTADQQIQRAMVRARIDSEEFARFCFSESRLPEEINAVLVLERESIFDLNTLCAAYDRLSPDDQEKLCAVVSLAHPEDTAELLRLAANLSQFTFFPDLHTTEELGRHLIKESGLFAYDENLSDIYDYAKLGEQKKEQLQGIFIDRGFISYHGILPLEEMMTDGPAEQAQREFGQSMGMGG